MDKGLPTKGFEELLGDALGGAFSDYRSCSQLQEEVVSFPHSFLYHLLETCSNLYMIPNYDFRFSEKKRDEAIRFVSVDFGITS